MRFLLIAVLLSGCSYARDAMREADDRGHPLDRTFTPDDIHVLQAAGDSVSRTRGSGVVVNVIDCGSM